MAKRGRPSTEERIDRMLELMSILSAGGGRKVGFDEIARELGATAEEARSIAFELSTFESSASGARAAVSVDEEGMALAEGSSLVEPVRLTPGETALFRHLLDDLGLAESTRDTLAKALGAPTGDDRNPSEGDPAPLLLEQPQRNRYLQLTEACDFGIRCWILYRKPSEREGARRRLVDPVRIEECEGMAYLVAWDTEAGGYRTFRLDRIDAMELTDESVERREAPAATLRESLADSGRRVRLHVKPSAVSMVRSWAGTVSVEADDDEGLLATVMVGDESWLYGNVLAAGGDIEIEDPLDLRRGLEAFAKELAADQERSCARLQNPR